MNKVVGLMLLVGGIILIILGVNAADSLSSEVSEFFTGNPTDRSIWFLIGGAIIAVAGIGALAYPRRVPA